MSESYFNGYTHRYYSQGRWVRSATYQLHAASFWNHKFELQ